jgi:SAM-dependent methyltransferase
MPFSIANIGLDTNIEVLRRHVSLEAKRFADIGCGNLTFTKILEGEGADVLAIDPDPKQAQLNRDTLEGRSGRIEFAEATSDAIPTKDGTLDGIFFSYSLHHIDAALYARTFQEVERTLAENGFVYVIEPIGGPLNEVMKLFHDEDAERAAAWSALENFSKKFQHVNVVEYHSIVDYENWDAFAANYGNRTFNSGYTFEDVARDEVREAFEKLATKTENAYQFQSSKRAVHLSN